MWEKFMLSKPEQRVLGTFRRFLITPGQMLCFFGPTLKQNEATFELLIDKELLVKERSNGGYSLTQAGFAAMSKCD